MTKILWSSDANLVVFLEVFLGGRYAESVANRPGAILNRGPLRKRTNVSSDIEALAQEVREGDGLDPRDEAKRKPRRARDILSGEEFHQQERLAGQIRTTIDLALQAASSPILSALMVHNVLRQKGTIVVVLLPREPSPPGNLVESAAALKRAEGMLRREVAAAITRKETPNLRFIVLPAGTEQIETDDRG